MKMSNSDYRRAFFDDDPNMSQSEDEGEGKKGGPALPGDFPTTNGASDPTPPNNPPMVDGASEPFVEYPATELIKELLFYVSAYEKLGRHINLSRQLNTRSTASYGAINRLITNFVNPVQNFEDAFRDFDTSSKAIPVLERILLDCYFADPVRVRRHIPDGDSVLDGITFIETWFADRTLLAQALDKFKFEGIEVKELEQGYLNSIIADDKAALEAIVKFYQQYDGDGKVQDRHIHGKGIANPVTEVKTAVTTLYKEIMAKPDHMDFLAMVLKSLMLLGIPFHLLDESRVTDNPLSVDYKHYLKNFPVWKEMLSLAKFMIEVVKTGINDGKLATLKEKYENLRKLLLSKTDIDNLATILSLIQLSAYIRRPFHARTAALIKAVYYIHTESDKTNIGGRYDLFDVLTSFIGILIETKDAVTDVRTISHLSDLYDSQTNKFEALFNTAKQCSKDLNLSNEAWDKHEAAFQAAVVIDKKNLDDAARFLSIKT